ncbi:MAG: hypothetical protein AAB692_05285 [Patescibacteria group bacterium]
MKRMILLFSLGLSFAACGPGAVPVADDPPGCNDGGIVYTVADAHVVYQVDIDAGSRD